MSGWKGLNWVKHITDEGRSGRPSTSRTEDHIDRADAMIKEDRRIMVSEVAARLDISYGSAYAILHDDLGYRKVCAWWFPKDLTVVHK